MFVRALALGMLAITPLFGYSANIVINPISGFSDATGTSPIGGNPGITLGVQRLNTFQKAADILETFLDIKIDVKVDASFSSLTCSAGSAILGSAGATEGNINQANAPLADTIYPVALANNLALSDINSTTAEISATFNADIDNNASCLNGVDWYYGYDDPTLAGAAYVNDTSFLSVVIHELLHGLGVSSWVQSNGALNNGFMDAYSANLYDQSTSKAWSAMNDSERLTSMTNTNNLVWTGSSVNTSTAALALTDGINSGKVEMYAPSPYKNGSSVSHFSTAATPNEIMEPSYTDFLTTPGIATQLLQDIGWAIPAAVNSAPIMVSIGALSSTEDNNKVVTLSATDADSNTVTFTASSDNGSVTASVSGTTLTLTPATNYFGTANITVTANDGTGAGNATDSEVVVYTVNSDNDLPVFTSLASGSIQYGNSANVSLTATDIETADGSIGFAVQSSNASQVTATISGSTLTLTPVNDYLGDTTITLRATDSDSGTVDQSYVLTIVAPANDAPVFTSSNSLTTLYGNNLLHSISASDTNSDELTFSLISHEVAEVTASLTGSVLALQANNNFTGSTSIQVSVSDGTISVSQTINLTVYEDLSLASSDGNLSQDTRLSISNNTFEFTLGGGDNIYTVDVEFDGQNATSALLTLSAGSYSLAMPESGAFAGDYTITITDGKGESADFIIQRPLKVTANISELTSTSTHQEIYIEGAPAASIIDLHINQGAGLLDLMINGAIITQVEAPDDANTFNRAVVKLDVNDASQIDSISISADSATLPAGNINLTTLPFHNIELTVNGSSGEAISASIEINDARFVIWGLSQNEITDSFGNLVLALPTDQTASILVAAENYHSQTVEIDAQVGQLAIVLELLDNPMTVSGSITTSTLNFVNEEPLVQLIASNGSTVQAELSAITASSVNYSVTINKLAFDAVELRLSHGDITQDVDILNNQFDSIINIHIDSLQGNQLDNPPSEPPLIEDPIFETSPAAGNSFILILCLLLLINFRKRRTLKNCL